MLRSDKQAVGRNSESFRHRTSHATAFGGTALRSALRATSYELPAGMPERRHAWAQSAHHPTRTNSKSGAFLTHLVIPNTLGCINLGAFKRTQRGKK